MTATPRQFLNYIHTSSFNKSQTFLTYNPDRDLSGNLMQTDLALLHPLQFKVKAGLIVEQIVSMAI